MDEQLSTTVNILEVLGDLELPLVTPIRETEEGYDVMTDLTGRKRLNKTLFTTLCKERDLTVEEIDVFHDLGGLYACFLINPKNRGM